MPPSFRIFLFLLGFSLLACAQKEKDYPAFAAETCNCFQPVLHLNARMESLMNAGKTTEAAALIDTIQMLFRGSRLCVGKAEGKFQLSLKGHDLQRDEALQLSCPKASPLIEQIRQAPE